MVSRKLWFIFAISVLGLAVHAQVPPPNVPSSTPTPGASATADSSSRDTTNLPPIRAIGPGIFEMGKVTFNRLERTASFPATLNLDKGLMEYFLVTTYGKTHESILRTDVPPLQIHLAMLLLGVKANGTNTLNVAPQPYGGTPGASIPGDPISIEVSWRQQGKVITRKAEELVARQDNHVPPPNLSWIYNGSAVWQGTFLAQQDGSLMSLITDSVALINLVRPKPDDDQLWTTNPDKLPPPGLPVQVTIKLLPLKDPKKN